MFKKTLKVDSYTDLISDQSAVTASEYSFSGILRVEGRLESDKISGWGETSTLVTASKSTTVAKEIKVANAVLDGSVVVDKITVTGTLKIAKDANIQNCEIFYENLEIERGAFIHECKLTHLET